MKKGLFIFLFLTAAQTVFAVTSFQDDFEQYTAGALPVGAGVTPGPNGVNADWIRNGTNQNFTVFTPAYLNNGLRVENVGGNSGTRTLQASFTNSTVNFTYIDIYFSTSFAADTFNLYFRNSGGTNLVATDLLGTGATGKRLRSWISGGGGFVMPAACDINPSTWRRLRLIGNNSTNQYKVMLDLESAPGTLSSTCETGWINFNATGPVAQIHFNDYAGGDSRNFSVDRIKVFEGNQDPSSDVTPPQLLSVKTADLNGNGYIDALRLQFNEAVDDSSVQNALLNNRISVSGVSGLAFNATAAGDTADNDIIFLTFNDNLLRSDYLPGFSYIYNATPGITDIVGNSLAAVSPTVADGAGPAVLSAIASDNAVILNGADGDDTVIFTFSEATNAPVITAANINSLFSLSNSHSWLDGAGQFQYAVWSSVSVPNDTLTIRMGGNVVQATISTQPADTVTCAGSILSDATGNFCSVPAANAVTLGGSFNADTTAPTVLSWVTRDLDGNGKIDAIRITLSEAIRDNSVTASDFNVTGKIGEIFLPGAEGDAADNNVIYIGFTEGAGFDTDSTPAVVYNGTLADLAGNLMANTSTSGAADGARPVMVLAVATDPVPVNPGINSGDYVLITFSEPTNQPALTDIQIDSILQLSNSHSWRNGSGATAGAVWNSSTVLRINLTAQAGSPLLPNVAVGDLITPDGLTIRDSALNYVNRVVPITGTFGDFAIQLAEVLDVDGDGHIDALRLTFNDNVEDDSVSAAALDVAGYSGETFNRFFNGDTEDNNVIYVTFTESASADTAALPTLSYTPGALINFSQNSTLAAIASLLPVDRAAPRIISAVAADTGAAIGPNAGDTVVVTFSENTGRPVLNAGNINQALGLSSSHSWLDGSSAIGSATWNPAGNILTVTLSDSVSAPTVAIGDSISTAASGTVIADAAANSGAGTFNVITGTFGADTIPPIMTAVLTMDADSDGKIDHIRVNFSEPVSDATVSAAAFALAGYSGLTFLPTYNSDVADNATVYFSFNSGGSADTGATPTLTYTAGGLQDAAGNSMVSASLSATDTAAPVLLTAVTRDTNSNGHLDAVDLTFSENISDATLTSATFSLAGYGSVTVVTGSTANDDKAVLTFAELAGFDTGALPVLSFSGSLNDAAANSLVATMPTVTDGAAPIIVAAETADFSANGRLDAVKFTFSESIIDAGVISSQFSITGFSGLSFLATAHGDAANNSVIFLDFTESASFDTGLTPAYAYTATPTNLNDAAGNPLAGSSGSAADKAAPVLLTAVTRDTNSNGHLDAVDLTFSENISDVTLTSATFALAGYGSVTVATGSTANDDKAVLTFAELAGFDTGALPVLSFSGSLNDAAANSLVATMPTATDGAAPVIVAAVASDGSAQAVGVDADDTVLITFSETVTPSVSLNTANIGSHLLPGNAHSWGNLSNVTVQTVNATNDTYLISFAGSGTTLVVGDTLQLNNTFSDGAANTSNQLFSALSGTFHQDSVPPTIVSRVTADSDGNGKIDRVVISFSEPVNDDFSAWNAMVTGYVVNSVNTGSTANDNIAIVLLQEKSAPCQLSDRSGCDTGAVPLVQVTANTSLRDLFPGNNLMSAEGSGTTATDGAAPVSVGARTRDLNANGKIDAMVFIFSENLPEAGIGSGATGFSIGGYSGVNFPGNLGGDIAGDDQIILGFNEGALPDTGATPAVSYAGGTAADSAANNLTTFSLTPVDGAAPVLLSAVASDGSVPGTGVDSDDTLVLIFSEGISPQVNLNSGNIDSHLALNNAHVWGGISSAQYSATQTTGDTVTVTFSGSGSTIAVGDTLTLTAGSPLADAALNVAIQNFSAVSGSFESGPVLLSRTTRDIDGDGKIDAVELVFSEAMNDSFSGLTATVAGYTVTGFSTGTTASDATVLIQLTEKTGNCNLFSQAGCDTAALPAVQITANTSLAGSGAILFPAETSALIPADGAAPVLLYPKTADLNGDGRLDALQYFFSENILDSSVAASDFDIAGFTGESFSSTTGGDSADDADFYIIFNGAPVDTSLKPVSAFTTGNLSDASGNNIKSYPVVASIDGAAPVIAATSTTPDGTYGSGGNVNITLQFSENVNLLSGNLQVTLNTGAIVTFTPFGPLNVISTNYPVASGETSSDLNVSSVSPDPGATLKDTIGNNAVLSIASGRNIADLHDIVIDGITPKLIAVTSATGSGIYQNGQGIEISLVFSEAVNLNNTAVFNLNSGGTLTLAAGSGTSFSGIYTVAAGENSSDLELIFPLNPGAGVNFSDVGGNPADLSAVVPATAALSAVYDITVDTGPPSLSSFNSSTPDGTYGRNSAVNLQVIFDEAVFLSPGAFLRLTLDSGAQVDVNSVSGITVSGSYVPQAGESSDDLAVTAISLLGGTLKDIAGNDAVLTLPSGTNLQDNRNIFIETDSPTINRIYSTAADGDYAAGAVIPVRVEFSENLVAAAASLQLNLDTVSGITSYVLNNDTLEFNYTVFAGENSSDLNSIGLSLLSGTLRDAAGNDAILNIPAGNSLADQAALRVDTTAPVMTALVTTLADGTYGAGTRVALQLQFSESVTLTGGELVLPLNSGGELRIAAFGLSSSATGEYVVAANETSPDLGTSLPATLQPLSAAIRDAAGNSLMLNAITTDLSAVSNLVIDGDTPKILSITSGNADGSYGVGSSISITVQFSESVALSGSLNIQLNSGAVVPVSSHSGQNLVFAYNPQSPDAATDLTVTQISLVSGILQDGTSVAADLTLPAGNNLADNRDIQVDTTAPALLLITATQSAGEYQTGDTLEIIARFTENVVLSGEAQLTLNNGVVLRSASANGTDVVFSYTVSEGQVIDPLDNQGTVVIAGNLRDTAGNDAILTLGISGQLAQNKKIIIKEGNASNLDRAVVAPSVISIAETGGTVRLLNVPTGVTVEVFDFRGRSLGRETPAVSAGIASWKVNSLGSGVYLVILTSPQGAKKTIKIVIQR